MSGVSREGPAVQVCSFLSFFEAGYLNKLTLGINTRFREISDPWVPPRPEWEFC